jgi:hypothetical protein
VNPRERFQDACGSWVKLTRNQLSGGREAKAALGFIGPVLGLDLLLLLDDGLFRRRAHSREGRRSVVVLISQSPPDLSHLEQGAAKPIDRAWGCSDEASRRPA